MTAVVDEEGGGEATEHTAKILDRAREVLDWVGTEEDGGGGGDGTKRQRPGGGGGPPTAAG
eukprot:gene3326-13503_t